METASEILVRPSGLQSDDVKKFETTLELNQHSEALKDLTKGSDNEDANKHIEKVLEIVDLFHIPNITKNQVMLKAFPMSLNGAVSHWLRNELAGSITTWESLKEIFLSKYCPPARTAKKMEEINYFQQDPDETLYQVCRSTETSDRLAAIQAQLNNLGREIKKVNENVFAAKVGCELFAIPFQQGGHYKAAALGFYQMNNGNPSYQERRQTMEESLSKFMAEFMKRHEENSNLIKEIRASTDGSRNLPRSTEINPRDPFKSISTTVEADMTPIHPIGSSRYAGSYELKDFDAYSIGTILLDDSLPTKEKDLGRLGELALTKLIVELADRTVKCPKGIEENVLVRIDKFVFLVDFIILDIPEDVKAPLILERPFLSTAHTKIDVFKKKKTLRIGNDKVFLDKPTCNIMKRVYVLSLRERMELDLETRLIGEALILNRSLDPLYGDYIELNDLNEPLKLGRN
ncbi:DNA-directed DNA polymerase [Tanacetum coccineum]